MSAPLVTKRKAGPVRKVAQGSGGGEPPIPASMEVLAHRQRLHRQACAGPHRVRISICPCGRTHAICCTGCGEAIFLALAPGHPACRHARDVLEAA